MNFDPFEGISSIFLILPCREWSYDAAAKYALGRIYTALGLPSLDRTLVHVLAPSEVRDGVDPLVTEPEQLKMFGSFLLEDATDVNSKGFKERQGLSDISFPESVEDFGETLKGPALAAFRVQRCLAAGIYNFDSWIIDDEYTEPEILGRRARNIILAKRPLQQTQTSFYVPFDLVSPIDLGYTKKRALEETGPIDICLEKILNGDNADRREANLGVEDYQMKATPEEIREVLRDIAQRGDEARAVLRDGLATWLHDWLPRLEVFLTAVSNNT